MEGLISLLMFAGLFYFMMRLGCGSHMVHGKHNHDANENKSDNNNTNHIDPVCGMKINMDKGYGMMHKGELHRFCSRKCLDKFESGPDSYITLDNKQGE